MAAKALVERCLHEMGPLEVSESTRMALLTQAETEEAVYPAIGDDHAHLTGRIIAVLGLIAAAPEYQLN